MHLRASGRDLLVGDAVAELLFRYAAEIGRRGTADAITIDAMRADGGTTRVTLLLNSGTELSAEAVSTRLGEPDNSATETRLRAALDGLRMDSAEEIAGLFVWNSDEFRA
jgi:hypothetical protein